MNKLDKAFKILAILNDTEDSQEGHLSDAINNVQAFIAHIAEKEPGLKLSPVEYNSELHRERVNLLIKMKTQYRGR